MESMPLHRDALHTAALLWSALHSYQSAQL